MGRARLTLTIFDPTPWARIRPGNWSRVPTERRSSFRSSELPVGSGAGAKVPSHLHGLCTAPGPTLVRPSVSVASLRTPGIRRCLCLTTSPLPGAEMIRICVNHFGICADGDNERWGDRGRWPQAPVSENDAFKTQRAEHRSPDVRTGTNFPPPSTDKGAEPRIVVVFGSHGGRIRKIPGSRPALCIWQLFQDSFLLGSASAPQRCTACRRRRCIGY